MASLTIQSEVYQGKLSDMARNAIIQTLRSMEGRQIEVVIKEKKRSLKQNKYRWSVVNATVMQYLNNYLEREGLPLATPEDVDIFIKDKALGVVHKVSTPLGEIAIAGRLKEKTTAEYENTMEAIRAYFAQKGIPIPLPRENINQ